MKYDFLLSWSGLPSHTGDLQRHAIQTAARAEVQSLSIGIAPVKVMGVPRRDDRTQVFAFWRDHSQTSRRRNIQIALLVHLDSVQTVLARRAGEIEKEFPIAKSAIGLHFITHDRLVLLADLTDGIVASARMLTCNGGGLLATYRYFSSGDNAMPLGPVKSLLTSCSLPL